MQSRYADASRRDLWRFLAWSHAWTWAFWTLAATSGSSVWQMPATVFFVIGGAGVFLGGIVMTRVTYGRAGLRDLLRRVADPARVGLRWWPLALLLYPALTFGAAGLALLAGVSTAPLDLTEAVARLADPLGLVIMMTFILIIGPLPEEIGWRGYLLDLLQERWDALTASLVLGLVWWSWHLPLFVLPGYFDAFGRAPTPFQLLSGILPSALVYTWVYNNTSRSVFGVIVLHFMQNFTGEFLGIDESTRSIRLVLEMCLAVVIAVCWWARRSRGDRSLPRASAT